jgi:hypothetical protein
MSSSSTHRSTRHRRQSQHQQQQSPAQQSSVSYVANKISFSLVNETNPPIMTTNKQNQDEYELITPEDTDRHYHHINPRESMDDDIDNPIVVEQLEQQAAVLVSNILASAMELITMTSED